MFLQGPTPAARGCSMEGERQGLVLDFWGAPAARGCSIERGRQGGSCF